MMIHGKCKIACTYHKIYEKIVTEAVTSLKRQAAMFVHTQIIFTDNNISPISCNVNGFKFALCLLIKHS